MNKELQSHASIGDTILATRVIPTRHDPPFQRDRLLIEAANVSISDLCHARNGTFVEIAGPTPGGYEVLHDIKLPRPVVVTSNVCRPGIMRIVNAASMDFEPGSVGMFLTSFLPYYDHDNYTDLHRSFMGCAMASLEQGGLVAMQGGTERDLQYANAIGYTILRAFASGRTTARGIKERWDFIATNATLNVSGYTLSLQS